MTNPFDLPPAVCPRHGTIFTVALAGVPAMYPLPGCTTSRTRRVAPPGIAASGTTVTVALVSPA